MASAWPSFIYIYIHLCFFKYIYIYLYIYIFFCVYTCVYVWNSVAGLLLHAFVSFWGSLRSLWTSWEFWGIITEIPRDPQRKKKGESRANTKCDTDLGSNQNQESRTKIPPRLLSKPWLEPKGRTKNQDLLRSPGGILFLGSWFWFEQRFAQESWGNLGSSVLVLTKNAFWTHSFQNAIVEVVKFNQSQKHTYYTTRIYIYIYFIYIYSNINLYFIYISYISSYITPLACM